jgi:hypothetical protein
VKCSGLAEIETHWSLTDLQDHHAALDLLEDFEARARIEAESKR